MSGADCGPVEAGRAHAAEPHMAQPGAPGRAFPDPVFEVFEVFEFEELQS
jgi:hypothetical protein